MNALGNISAARNKANGVLKRSGYASGGAVGSGEKRPATGPGGISPDFKGKGPNAKGFKAGGTVSGAKAPVRLDKFARGGRCGKTSTVNVIVAPGAGAGGGAPPMPPPMMPPPPMGGPPPMMGPPPGGGMPGMSGGGRRYAKGGAVAMDSNRGSTPPGAGKNKTGSAHKNKYAAGGKTSAQSSRGSARSEKGGNEGGTEKKGVVGLNPKRFQNLATGGVVRAKALVAKPGYDGGAGGGIGRLEKVKEYGGKRGR